MTIELSYYMTIDLGTKFYRTDFLRTKSVQYSKNFSWEIYSITNFRVEQLRTMV